MAEMFVKRAGGYSTAALQNLEGMLDQYYLDGSA